MMEAGYGTTITTAEQVIKIRSLKSNKYTVDDWNKEMAVPSLYSFVFTLSSACPVYLRK